MSQEMFLRFPPIVSKADILAALSTAAGKRGVVTTDPDQHEEPDPDEYVRPGFEGSFGYGGDERSVFTRYVGTRMGKRAGKPVYKWMELSFSHQGGRWSSLVELRDLDEDQLLLVGAIAELLRAEPE
jgi:hypothetical protein